MDLIGLSIREYLVTSSPSSSSSTTVFATTFLSSLASSLASSLISSLLSRCNRCEDYCEKYCGDRCGEKCEGLNYIDISESGVGGTAVFLTELLFLFFSKRSDLRRQSFVNSFLNCSLLNLYVRFYIISRFIILISSQCSFSRAILFFFRWSTFIRSLLMILSIMFFVSAALYTFSSFSESFEFQFSALIYWTSWLTFFTFIKVVKDIEIELLLNAVMITAEDVVDRVFNALSLYLSKTTYDKIENNSLFCQICIIFVCVVAFFLIIWINLI